MGAPPFTPARVTRFLLFCLLGALVIIGLYILLTHAEARQGVPHQQSSLPSFVVGAAPAYAKV